jgi:hypothetical protein
MTGGHCESELHWYCDACLGCCHLAPRATAKTNKVKYVDLLTGLCAANLPGRTPFEAVSNSMLVLHQLSCNRLALNLRLRSLYPEALKVKRWVTDRPDEDSLT